MAALVRDLRHAARAIARMPGLAAVVIGSLAVGIAANTIVFSWVQAVVFTPIPGVAIASRLHLVEPRTEAGLYPGASWLEYRDLRERLRVFDELIAFRMIPLYVGERGQVERSTGLLVSDNYFAGLGLTPALGRFLRRDEVERPGAAPVVVISYDYWQTRFAGAGDVPGRRVRVNGVDLTIVGVAPRGFKGTVMRLMFDFWLPATLAPAVLGGARDLEDRGIRAYTVTGPLAAGANAARAQSEVDAAMAHLARTYPAASRNVQGEVLPYWRAPRGPQRMLGTSLGIMQAIMLLLLLAVCGNTANLVLARASARQREMGMRLALGAGRWRIASLLLTESVLLALAGAAVGAVIAAWGTGLLNAMPPLRVRGIPVSFETSVDWGTLAFAIGLGVACGLIFGMAPAVQLARLDVQQALRAAAATPRRSYLRHTLMAAEVALAVMVLVAAGIFLRNFMNTRHEDPGFTRAGILLAGYDLSVRPSTDTTSRTFAATLLDRLNATAGIEKAAIASAVPLDIHGLPMRLFTLEGRPPNAEDPDEALTNTVTPGYFAVMGLPILSGSDFVSLRDDAAPRQAIVNEAFVRRYAPGRDPVGLRLDTRGRQYTIAGVVKNSLYNSFGEPPTPIIYLSYRDRPSAAGEIHLRTRPGTETAIAMTLRSVVRDLDPELPVFDVRTLSDHIEANLIFRRIPARMFGVLAPLLLLLAAIGIYAVVAYSVALRTMEIGVRLALGATPARVVAQFVAEHLVVVTAGALVGWVAAFAVVIAVFGAAPDAVVFAAVPAALLAVAAAAAWWPARRVSRVSPLVALRI
ncbi:MAG TPA: ADOP family duplicated permease [Vicinamibacterales bacterium]|nr:ADOP family duplicated permease [Vicinamibacterales bacterium]